MFELVTRRIGLVFLLTSHHIFQDYASFVY
ncbi:hypothetical protein Zm00014a_004560 [Zea mays]|uniref:Uncharacterized protein n=1 Tax=Zea mays TaxID=4577 RepID=A0A3L6E1X1_MAIZE|nr:hypothetical protein Zm00014a_004560 [Zea mays]